MKAEMETLHFQVDGNLIERRRVARVTMEAGDRVRDAIKAGVMCYGDAGELYAFVRSIPSGAQEFTEMSVADALVTLVQASWVPVGVVMVGRGGQADRDGIYAGFWQARREAVDV